MYPQKIHLKPPKSVTHLYVGQKLHISRVGSILFQDKIIFKNMKYFRIKKPTKMSNIWTRFFLLVHKMGHQNL